MNFVAGQVHIRENSIHEELRAPPANPKGGPWARGSSPAVNPLHDPVFPPG